MDGIEKQPKKTKGGYRPGSGRPKGSPNKLTATIKEAIEASFEMVGGAEYLARMADEQPQAYMTLLGKVLPTQVQAAVQVTPGYHFIIEAAGEENQSSPD